MITYRQIVNGLRQLGIQRHYPVIAHTSSKNMREIKGGADALLGGLLTAADNLLLPAFTHGAMIIPETGPEENAMEYGSGRESNLNAKIFTPDLPSDMPEHELCDKFRSLPSVRRSSHPILSFMGLGLNAALEAQSSGQPWKPIQFLADHDGWVLLLGVDQIQNISLHWAEQQVGRKQFVRWALTPQGVTECPNFPGCPNGFNKIQYHVKDLLHQISLDSTLWQAYPLQPLLSAAVDLMNQDPYALLCNNLACERCNTVRRAVRNQPA
jgi:aminoglycoside 3-N-acetyltransferase